MSLINCANCGAALRRKPSHVNRYGGKSYCSIACWSNHKGNDSVRIIDLIEQSVRIPESGCWIYMGTLCRHGYPTSKLRGKRVYYHRWIYEQLHGPVGDLTIDHLCRVRCCVNPNHMEAVTNLENVQRGARHRAKEKAYRLASHPAPSEAAPERQEKP